MTSEEREVFGPSRHKHDKPLHVNREAMQETMTALKNALLGTLKIMQALSNIMGSKRKQEVTLDWLGASLAM